jgi:hypothetical protein
MPKYFRVADKETGNHFTVAEGAPHLTQPDRYKVIDLPALDKSGRPRPAKYPSPKTTPAPAVSPATSAKSIEAKKEAKES